ncbi:enolase 2, putative [Perkinsus marinus ATCC 50983]|uniref:phosphopyruvate hydratase n=1 Tax=Perkinsus marinus (strain ATCC 50983 / TXsc) TaxID=423536 RepID=C5KDY9_PERM5|nr:enolase 2, putative [Perkinsus marinus ATCC 50983]EER17442.1 enolase 2, putative [Perkinsus marinus ATCC 50983]|eukprot:XP_002785646.1 enolase 2, putative [Perkinsus marinus ATCC 50983]
MSKIISVKAREILDSRGNPTVEVDLVTDRGMFRAACPSGASTGEFEALELRDGDKKRYGGKGVQKAVDNVNKIIGPAIIGKDPTDQTGIDKLMVEELDGTQNEWGWCKAKLGANAILGVSMAVCRAGAATSGMPLYKYIAKLAGKDTEKFTMPCPCFNVINGGKHAGNRLACQEFMLVPCGAKSIHEAIRFAAEVYHELKSVIKAKYGQDATNVGDEGGFAPSIQDMDEALKVLEEAIKKSGHEETCRIGCDFAASECLDKKSGKYDLDFKNSNPHPEAEKTGDEMVSYLESLINQYPFVFLEDPFDENDWDTFTKFTAKDGKNIQIVGDDLLVTNPKRIQKGIDDKACNALLLKVNQIGSVTESIEANNKAVNAGWTVMVSHRSGETEDTFIADLVVGLGTGQIKTGAPCRTERLCKYNQLMRIEEELGAKAYFAGGKNFPRCK